MIFLIAAVALAAVVAAAARAPKVIADMTRPDFLKRISPLAKVIEVQLGIPLDITVTQAAHESNWGSSGLTKSANNLFGMTGESWKAAKKPVVEMPTDEYVNGKFVSVKRPFRKYDSWLESCKDWANNIATTPRYASAYQAARAHNSQLFFTLVAAAGYATDPNYGQKLVLVRDAVKRELEALA